MPPKILVGLNRMPASQGFARPFTVLSAYSPFLYSIRALPNNLHYFYFSAQVKLATDLQNTSKKYCKTYLQCRRSCRPSWHYRSNMGSCSSRSGCSYWRYTRRTDCSRYSHHHTLFHYNSMLSLFLFHYYMYNLHSIHLIQLRF